LEDRSKVFFDNIDESNVPFFGDALQDAGAQDNVAEPAETEDHAGAVVRQIGMHAASNVRHCLKSIFVRENFARSG
jgi:hypothetical protein